MRMLKKLSACAVAGAMAMAFGAVSSFAASVTVGEITAVKGEDNVYTVTVPYTATDVDQVTLLGSIAATADAAVPADITYSNTAYIDQEAQDGSFVFKVDASRFTEANPWLQIRLGGTGLDAAVSGTAQELYVAPAPATPITSADVIGAVDGDITNAYETANASIVRLDVSQLIADSKLDLATQVVKINGVAAKYTVYNGVTKLVACTDISAGTVSVAIEDGVSEKIMYADTNKSTDITLVDAVPVVNMALKTATSTDVYDYIIADTNADGSVSLVDAVPVVNMALKTADSCPAMTK